jgi:hypothetical protein
MSSHHRQPNIHLVGRLILIVELSPRGSRRAPSANRSRVPRGSSSATPSTHALEQMECAPRGGRNCNLIGLKVLIICPSFEHPVATAPLSWQRSTNGLHPSCSSASFHKGWIFEFQHLILTSLFNFRLVAACFPLAYSVHQLLSQWLFGE